MEVWGFSRRLIEAELYRLSQAIWDVLSRTRLDFDCSVTLMERIDGKILGTLGWPREGWGTTQEQGPDSRVRRNR